MVNRALKDRWFEMPDEDKDVWKKWQVWDRLRHKRDMAIYRKPKKTEASNENNNIENIQKRQRDSVQAVESSSNTSFHIPKKKRS